MKCKVTYDFDVEHRINGVSKQLGKSIESIKDISDDEIIGLYENLKSGDVNVTDYYSEPVYYKDEDLLYATFYAQYSTIVEGKNEAECKEKAQKLFENTDCGDYTFDVGCEVICNCEIMDKHRNIEKE